ncbi:formate dehydrogenase subunit gamma, partial [Bradyrhizobium sp. LeoA1S1]
MTFLARFRLATFVLALLAISAAAPVFAQERGPDGAPNPTASVTSQHELLQQMPRITGRIDIPDTRASVLIQPAGRTWEYFHQVLLRWGGAIVILGTVLLLAIAY